MNIFEDDSRIPVTKDEARRLGSNKYRTGELCQWGHRAYRYVKSGVCVECQKRDHKKYRARQRVIKNDRKFRTLMGL